MERKDYNKPVLKPPETKKEGPIYLNLIKETKEAAKEPLTALGVESAVFKAPETNLFRALNGNLRDKKTPIVLQNGGQSPKSHKPSIEPHLKPIEKLSSMIMVRKTYEKCNRSISPASNNSLARSEGSESDTDTAESNQEEFYKYLGIHMRPHEIVQRPDFTDLDIFKRRSLRVRYQKIVNNNFQPPASTEEPEKVEVIEVKKPEKLAELERVEPPVSQPEKEPVPFLKFNDAKKSKVERIKDIVKRRVNYLMRSQVSPRSLRSGTERKDRRPVKTLNMFKSKRKFSLRTKLLIQNNAENVKLVKAVRKKVEPVKPKVNKSKSVAGESEISRNSKEKKPRLLAPGSPLPQAPDSTVHLRCSIDDVQKSSLSHSDLNTLKNPLQPSDGDIIHVYSADELLVAVQTSRISFWRYSTFKQLVGVEQTYELVGRCRRHNETDIEINPSNTNRLCLNESHPFYIELRARQLPSASDCPLASCYVVLYFVSPKGPSLLINENVIVKYVQLDTVQACAENEICFIPIPSSRYLIMSWNEHLIENKYRTGLCKYSFTPDLSSLASIREVPPIKHRVLDLKCLKDNKLLGLGTQELSIWNHESGDLLISIDFGTSVGKHLFAFEFQHKMINCLFLVQVMESSVSDKKSIKTIGVNLGDLTWHVMKEQEIAASSVNDSSDIRCGFTKNMIVASVDFGRHLIVASRNDVHSINVHQTRTDQVKLFLDCENIIEVSDKAIVVRGMDEYLTQL